MCHAGRRSCGLYLNPPLDKSLADVAHFFVLFALHTSVPYVRCFPETASTVDITTGTGVNIGQAEFFSRQNKLHGTSFKGGFTVGVWWDEPV